MKKRVLIVEPDLVAHHAFWLTLIVQAYQEAGWEVHALTDPDDPQWLEQAELRGLKKQDVHFHRTEARDNCRLIAQAARISTEIEADTVFIAYLDRFWDELLGQASNPAFQGKLSGIWFHPHALDGICRWLPPLDKRWSLRGRIHRFLRSSQAGRLFQRFFFLFDEAVMQLQRLNPSFAAAVLPDPYEREPRLNQLDARAHLNIPAGRTVFLHLGSPEKRKGLPDVIAAFTQFIRRKDQWERPPLLLRVGPNDRLSDRDRASLEALVAGGHARVVASFVPSRDLMEYFSAADWILIPYRKFRFSSGILANAIGAMRPVIVADYGHTGRDVVRHRMGFVFKHGSIADLLMKMVEAAETEKSRKGYVRSEDGRRLASLRSSEVFIKNFKISLTTAPNA